ncbi:hypothetical protein K466DRAFT_490199 [Polyporus arcularius HHB13444]|uniref:Uncharacterized protein n=1 Tax=Polyporus arcularius HHB13444 TaxID=1314778 RepID=A0A5C3PHS7_9APHY|nr:hypothetical protein K466DRAFT_490199 [Polyporus arcularius HHB13444]
MDPETHAALHHWKMHRYQYHHIPFADAVRSLSTKKPLIEIKRASRPNEWIACYTGTSNPAVMTYAGVFSEAEPYDTGNLVWGNNEPPPDLEESRITHFAGFKASYSFAIETYHDREIWELQRDVEEYVVTVPGFNIGRVPRLEWQNGHLAMMRFFMRVPMFFPHQTRGPQPRAPDSVHPWVKAAHAKSRTHRANPRPPKVRAIENGVLRPIAECAQKKLEYGDVVGLVFTLGFTETPTSWSPVYMLSDVIRVMRANRDAFPAPTEEQPDETPAYSDDFSITDTPSRTSSMSFLPQSY